MSGTGITSTTARRVRRKRKWSEGEEGDLRLEIGTRFNFGGSMAPLAPPLVNSEEAGSLAGISSSRLRVITA